MSSEQEYFEDKDGIVYRIDDYYRPDEDAPTWPEIPDQLIEGNTGSILDPAGRIKISWGDADELIVTDNLKSESQKSAPLRINVSDTIHLGLEQPSQPGKQADQVIAMGVYQGSVETSRKGN